MGKVVYADGPCEGHPEDVPDVELADGFTVCRGFQYRVYQVAEGEWLAQAPSRPAPIPSDNLPTAPSAGPDVLTTSTALGGWNNLMHVLGRSLPASLQQANNARRIIRGG